jgi:hypothetical protein
MVPQLMFQGFNGIHYKNQIYNPLFAQIQAGETVNPKLVASATFDGIGGGDIVARPQLDSPACPADLTGKQPGWRYSSPLPPPRPTILLGGKGYRKHHRRRRSELGAEYHQSLETGHVGDWRRILGYFEIDHG